MLDKKGAICYNQKELTFFPNFKKGGCSLQACRERQVMKKFARIIALMLALVSCLLVIVACDGNGNDRGYEVKLSVDENGVVWAEDEWGYWRQYDELPFDLDYEEETITVLCWDSGKAEFIQTEEAEDARLSSIYKRNEAVQARLNIELNFITEHSSAGAGITTFAARVQNAKNSGMHDFDIISVYSRTQGALLLNGLLYDLNEVNESYLDLEKPWWPSNIVDNLSIADSLYFVSGDIAVTAIDEMHCIYFNKDFLDERFETRAQAEDFDNATAWLYDKVYNGKWTLDLLIDLATSNIYKDKTENGPSLDDDYGLCAVYYTISSFYGSCNLRMIQKDPNKTLVLSNDFTSNRTTRLVSKLANMMSTQHYHDSYTVKTGDGGSNIGAPFKRGNALFYVTYMEFAEDYLVKSDAVENYGVLPLPKYDTNQKNYYTVLGNPFSIYSVFVDFDGRGDKEESARMLTAVLECWASESYRKCTPVVFELNLQLKYSPTQDETNMCEYIRAGIMFDLGRILDTVMAGKTGEVLVLDNLVIYASQQNSAWTTYYQKDLNTIQTNLSKFVTTMNNNWQ